MLSNNYCNVKALLLCKMIQVVFPIGFKGKARNLSGICLPLYASCGGLKSGRNTKVDLPNIIVMTLH